jgi:hypothetical protein
MIKFNRKIIIRILIDVVAVLLLIISPWWISLWPILLSLFFFDMYLEIIFFGMLYDALYAPHSGILVFVFTLSGFLLFSFKTFLAERLRM